MEDVLDLYERPVDPAHPRICFDELPCQLIGDILAPLPMQAGNPRKQDFEYERLGVFPIFFAYDLDNARRYVQVRQHRTKADYALFWDWLISTYYPDTPDIEVVQDNLNTHSVGSFYENLPAIRAHHLKNQLHFHFTPKHGSWLNMAEMELSALSRHALNQRFASRSDLEIHALAWQHNRNAACFHIHWSFTTSKARLKLHRHYSTLNPNN